MFHKWPSLHGIPCGIPLSHRGDHKNCLSIVVISTSCFLVVWLFFFHLKEKDCSIIAALKVAVRDALIQTRGNGLHLRL